MGNYRAVSEIMQRNPNIGIRLDGRLTLMGSQAADYLLNNNGFGDETNAFLGYGQTGQQGQAVPLSGIDLEIWKDERDKMLKLLKDKNSDCYKYLKKLKFDPKKLAKELATQTPYDALESTNDANDDFGEYGNTIKKHFEEVYNVNGRYDDAVTGQTGRVYYTPTGLSNGTIILHEAIHVLYKGKDNLLVYNPVNGRTTKKGKRSISDKELMKRMNIPKSSDTRVINKELEKNGCK